MNKRILIVDDSAPTRGLVRKFIESRSGFEICGEATDGAEGVEKAHQLRPDLILLDFSMPQMNGLQAALIIHQKDPITPIILFTFYKDVLSSHVVHAVGVASIISKSDPLPTLADEIQILTRQN
jgi:two-component system nitrate/nitrite response regulator NarL